MSRKKIHTDTHWITDIGEIPKQHPCTKCNNSKAQTVSLVKKVLEKKGISLEGYLEKFICRSCKSNTNRIIIYHNKPYEIPKKIKCKECFNDITLTQSKVKEKLESTGENPGTYLSEYICRNCKKVIRENGELPKKEESIPKLSKNKFWGGFRLGFVINNKLVRFQFEHSDFVPFGAIKLATEVHDFYNKICIKHEDKTGAYDEFKFNDSPIYSGQYIGDVCKKILKEKACEVK